MHVRGPHLGAGGKAIGSQAVWGGFASLIAMLNFLLISPFQLFDRSSQQMALGVF